LFLVLHKNNLLQQWTQYELCYLNLFRQNLKAGGPDLPENKWGELRPMRPLRSATYEST